MRPLVAATATAAIAVLLLTAGPATAAELPGAGNLSPRLAKLARPSVLSAPPSVQADELGLVSEGPGSLLRRGNRVLVYVRFDRGAIAGLRALRRAGAEVVVSSRRYQTVTAAVKPDELVAMAAVPRVVSVREALAPVVADACPAGEVVSAGVGQMKAGEGTGEARATFGVDGSGVTVGILSDSFDQATEAADGSGTVKTHALEDEESGDLPGPDSPCANKDPVDVLQPFEPEFEGEEAFDEGRAMAQIVHDVAPGAAIDFASAFNGEESFAANIEALAEGGADVIADDVFYLGEPFFQEGPVAVAATKAVKGGAVYLSAAGNDNLLDAEGNEIASWETPAYRDAGGCPQEVQALPTAVFNGSHCLDFDPGQAVDRTFGIRVKPHRTLTVDLQWDEPWFGVKTDLDAFLLDSEGHLIEAEFSDNVHETQQPAEILEWVNESSSTRTVQLVVNRFSGGSPPLKFALLENGSGVAATEYPRSSETDTVGPAVFGHSAAASTVSVGAIDVGSTSEPEEYSSRGPARHDFGPVTGTKPAAPLLEPEVLSKPDVVAGDCGATTFFAQETSEEEWLFCGTSAAAPHAAGVAALMLDHESGASPDEIHTALQESGTPIGSPPFGACTVGAGLVDAVKAIEALPLAGGYSPPECLGPAARVSDEEARVAGDWGVETPPEPPSTATTTATVSSPATGETRTLVRPRTFIRAHPPHLIRTRRRMARVAFRFGSDQAGVHFVCQVDDGLFSPCPPLFVRRFALGLHTVRVAARDADGAGDRTPAVFRFRVKRIR
ncbi:MAG TPA: S8 family serine peptidase [Solirubrobacterales bacterium]